MTFASRFAGRRLAGALAIALVVCGAVQAQDLVPIDRPVAVVDEEVVLRSELDRAVHNITAQYAGRADQLPPADVLERQVLERLILTKLQVARATSSGINATEEDVDAAIGRIAEGNSLTEAQLRQQVTQTQSWEEFRRSIKEEIQIQQLRQSFAQGRITVSESEVDAAMAAETSNSQYHLAHILIALPDGATAEQIATGQSKVEGVKALIDKGEMDFAAAAVRYSDSQNALEGGDLGWRALDEIPATFANVIRGMQPGQVIGPVRGPSGFQLLKLVEIRDAAADGAATVTEFNARHILALVDDTHPEAEARAKIETLAARLAGGAEFQALARENSEDANTKSNGGDLGWFPSDRFGTTFGAQVASLADGAVSKPFRSEAGWHIVQRVGTRQAKGDQNRRSQMREAIGRRKLEDEYNRFLREMRGEAFVELRTGQPATEAAPADTQPPANGG
jgi:peptidyl-prolyl cis-trans isomerase SurA